MLVDEQRRHAVENGAQRGDQLVGDLAKRLRLAGEFAEGGGNRTECPPNRCRGCATNPVGPDDDNLVDAGA